MLKDFYAAVQARRTYYHISKVSAVADERIQEVIEQAVQYAPSSFHSQSARVALLLGENQDKLWDIAKEALRKIVPAEQFGATEAKIHSFRSGYGSVLFFEDQDVVEKLQREFALYAANFPIWSQQSSGMLQYIVWTALELEGFGASLQHYNELIESAVKEEWNIPGSWKLIAQMPFGRPTASPDAKTYQPLSERIKVFK